MANTFCNISDIAKDMEKIARESCRECGIDEEKWFLIGTAAFMCGMMDEKCKEKIAEILERKEL